MNLTLRHIYYATMQNLCNFEAHYSPEIQCRSHKGNFGKNCGKNFGKKSETKLQHFDIHLHNENILECA